MFAPRNCRGQRNIVYPYWELPRLPTAWKPLFGAFDACWAPTTFIRTALEELLSRPVPLVPQPVYLPATPPQQSFAGPLTIHTFFDFDSYVARKNPLGAIRAFRAAFPTGREDVRLVVKARGQPDEPARRQLFDCAQDDPRIAIIDRTLTRVDMSALMEACHVFISLHRSEGFGLGCAEALAHGKCVVATDFGGSRDFINERTGFPVTYRAVAVTERHYVGAEGGSSWAEPNIDHAASLLREIYDAPEGAAERARAGFFHLKSTHSFEATSNIIKQII